MWNEELGCFIESLLIEAVVENKQSETERMQALSELVEGSEYV